MTRPVALAVNVAGIPAVLRALLRWVLWRYVWDEKRWTKHPYQVSGRPAKSDDPSTWTTFAHVCIAYQTTHFDGISFALGDGYGGVDVDKYLGHECNLIEQIPGYRERSPGALGIKIIGRSDRIGGQIDFVQEPPIFTRWSSPRFFAITGQDASGDPLADLSPFIDEWFPAPVVNLTSTREGYAGAADMDDEYLLAQMVGGGDEQADKRLALFRGDTSAYGGDHSRADQALVCHLAWFCNYDIERIDRLFRMSGLMRDKWNKASYRKATIGKALR